MARTISQDPPSSGRAYRLYGRRTGRPLRSVRRALMESLLPQLAIPLPASPACLDPATLFDFPVKAVWLEIGFGGGEHLAAQAGAHPDVGLIGCESFLSGIGTLLTHIREAALANIRIYPNDGRDLLASMAPATLDRAFILFPDPWPKKRHHKRRLISPSTLESLARVLRDGAELRLASDDAGYVAWMEELLVCHPAFESAADGANRESRPADWPPTRYEAKARAAGRKCRFLRFFRRARLPENMPAA